LDKWTTNFTSFPWTWYEPVVNFCWKRVLSSFFLYFLRSPYMQPCGWECPGVEGQVSRKEVCFAHKILVFHFFSFFVFFHGSVWCHLQWAPKIWMWIFWFFSRNFIRSIVFKFWIKTLINKKNFSSLIITNMELRFEPCVLNLIWKWGAKDPKKREDHVIFINFGVKKFKVKDTQKKLNFNVWML
jgi:hypothetical protein